jgi:hypothetical protein
MRYRVHLQKHSKPSFMVTCNGVVIHVTHSLHWALGHDFEDVHAVLNTLNARWEALNARIDKPNHSNWLDYDGDASGAVIQ